VEKPDAKTATSYLLSGHYLWNSGMFLFQIRTYLEELKLHCPAFAEKIRQGHVNVLKEFCELPATSIDYALMEKSKRALVMSLEVSWSDVGCWDSVYEILDKDEHCNATIGNVCALETKNCLIVGNKRLVSTLGLDDLFIIETDDALLIGKKGESQKVKQLYEELHKKQVKESQESLIDYRPWGQFTVLEEGARYKIKRIVVEPMQKLSLQKHYHRSEHWIVVKGCAKTLIGDEENLIYENESVFVPKGCVHRLENPGKVRLEIIEVQVGEYVGEDDIVRLEDIYQRS
jgi:mannose-1-phosphate guanylyltransferase/mannose-6-phosphate isomerase